MGFRKTLADIVGRGLLAGTLLFSPINSHAQQQKRAEISARQQYSVEVSKENPEFSFEVPMNLYRDTTTKRFSEGTLPIYFEGRMDYDTSTFYFSYSSGKMTEEGPLLGKRNIEEAKKFLPEKVPFLDDNSPKIYFVSTGKDIFLDNLKQWRWAHDSANNPQRVLMDFSDTAVGRLSWWIMNKGVDYSVDEVDATILSGGLRLVPFIGQGVKEVINIIVDEFELGPLRNLKKYLEKRAEEAKEREKESAFRSLENAVYIQPFPVFSALKGSTARAFEMTLRNEGFEDEKVAFLIKSLPVQNKSTQHGNLHGEIQDVGIVVNLPSLIDFNNFLGTWEAADGVGAGRYMRNAVYVLDRDKITLIEGSNKDSMPLGTKKVFDKNTIGFFPPESYKAAFLRSLSPNRMWMTFGRFNDENEFRSFKISDLEKLFEEDRVELRLVGGRKLFMPEQEKELEKLEGVWTFPIENDNRIRIVFLKKPQIIFFAREDKPPIVCRYSGFEKNIRGYFRFDILNDFLSEEELMGARDLFFEPLTKSGREFIALHTRLGEEDMTLEFNKEGINVENLRYYFYPKLSRNMLNKDFVIVGMNYPILNQTLEGDFGAISLAEGGKFVVPKKSDHPLDDGKPFTIEEVRSFRGLPFLFVNGRKKVEVKHPVEGTLEILVGLNGVLTADKDGSPIFSTCFAGFNKGDNLTRNLSEKENNDAFLEKLRVAAGASFLNSYYILKEK